MAKKLPFEAGMSKPLRDLLLGPRRPAIEAVEPHWSFDRVILPPSTRRQISEALGHIFQHDLIFRAWGLGEIHASGLGLAFNFAGPPGTGKTICAEAIAFELSQPLIIVRYSEVESMWAGETAKNVRAVFEAATEQDAVLFFDEADAIAARRSTSVREGYTREANLVVNVLLNELEQFNGVVIFATNLARNFDPAFERRIRTHIYFEQPGPREREAIWRAQIHEHRTPLASDVDFGVLAAKYERSGGDIKNAVLKAALMAADEDVADEAKQIRQEHFERAMQEVIAAGRVLDQSVINDNFSPEATLARMEERQSSQQVLIEDAMRQMRRPLVAAVALASIAVAIALVALAIAIVF
jgi:SpoVK/Ycf46/Vps4 family AAA+-type ATPase